MMIGENKAGEQSVVKNRRGVSSVRKGGERERGGLFRVVIGMTWVESLWESCQCQLPLSPFFPIIPPRH